VRKGLDRDVSLIRTALLRPLPAAVPYLSWAQRQGLFYNPSFSYLPAGRILPTVIRLATKVRSEHESLARQADGCVTIAAENLLHPQEYQELHLTQAD